MFIGTNPIILPDGAAQACTPGTECTIIGAIYLAIVVASVVMTAYLVWDTWRDM